MTDPVTVPQVAPEDVPAFDQARAEAAVRELLHAIGEDPEREGLLETPARVARAYAELTQGLRQSPRDVLTTTFDLGHEEMVLVRDIELWSMCEHHLVPFHGLAHVGYIPNVSGRLTGLSKLARLVDVFARRPQVQERLGEQIADTIAHNLDTRGVLVVMDAVHGCVTMRGGRQTAASTLTVAARGDYTDPVLRAEIIALIGSGSA